MTGCVEPSSPAPHRAWRRFPIWGWVLMVGTVLVVAVVVVVVMTGGRPNPLGGPDRSQLVDLTMPAGSTLIESSRASEWDAAEFWDLALPFDQEVQAIRSQLPVGGDLQGLAWCLEERNEEVGYVHWRWGDAQTQRMIVVDVYRLFSPLQKHGGVNIHKSEKVPEPCGTS